MPKRTRSKVEEESKPQITLYGDSQWISPYFYTVFVALKEKKLEFTLEEKRLMDKETRKAEYTDHVLTGRIPAIKDGDFYLAESSAIVEYLEDKYPQIPIFPKKIEDKAVARQILHWVRSDIMGVRTERDSSSIFYPENRKGEKFTEKGQVDVDRVLHLANKLIPENGDPIFGDWSIADADLAFVLQRLNANNDPLPEKIKKYLKKNWDSRPSVQEFATHKRPTPYVKYY